MNELLSLIRRYAEGGNIYVETTSYQECASNNKSYKNKDGEKLKEFVVYYKTV